ncbi:MAG: membrane fusion protein (multidrug efflux system) [Methylophilaceae bacterium]|jgi:membrane fusion protein (multidrug efflux system)
MHKPLLTLFLFCSVLFLQGCGFNDNENSDKKQDARTTLVTVTTVKNQAINITQSSVGSLEGLINPTLAAEMAGRIIKVHVNTGDKVKKGQLIATLDARDSMMQRNEALAEVARIRASLGNQTKIVSRNKALMDKNFISQSAFDNEVAQESVFKQQLVAAKARVASINHDSSKSKVFAPVSGIIESNPVDTGDYLRVGDPIVQIVSTQALRAHLPFPEQFGPQLKPGLTVRLKTPSSTETIETVILELKPLVAEGNRTIDVIADVNNAKDWQPGATVTGEVTLSTLPAAMMIPEQSLVLRPAGEVVYVVRENIAHQAIVKTGLRQQGFIEIISGLKPNDLIVVDGAGFLTDKAPVKIAKNDAT